MTSFCSRMAARWSSVRLAMDVAPLATEDSDMKDAALPSKTRSCPCMCKGDDQVTHTG